MLGAVWSHVASLSARARWTVAALAVAVVCGALVLALTAGRGQMVPLDSPVFPASELGPARGMLADCGIASRVVSGRLRVPAAHLAAARDVLAPLARRPQDALEALSALAEEGDIWRTAAQNDKRWHAAKMGALSRLVETFPSVARATVLYEPGYPRGLGGGQEPTAAVKVTMRPGATLARSVAGAIADLVAGSIAGLSSRNVHVVDGSGRSYRFDAASEQADRQLRERRAVETYYHEKIHAALAYIDKVVIGVSVADTATPGEVALVVSVAVPRSYLAAACAGRSDPSAAERAIAGIRQATLAAAGDRPCQVTAEWYSDADAAIWPQAAAFAPPGRRLGWLAFLVTGFVSAGCGAGAGWLVRRYYLALRSHAQEGESGAAAPPKGAQPGAERGQPLQSRPWDFLGRMSTDEILSLVAAEHPQTIAIVLGQLSPAQAAAVLGGLSEDTQAAVGRRVAALHQVDPVVIAEVARGLAERAAELARAGALSAGPEGRVAEMLRHAGPATERTVLSALAGQTPAVAEAVRRRLFGFEDIAQLPAERLRAALGGVDTAELAVALRTASQDLKAKVLAGLTRKAARRVRQEMDRMVPVRLTEVEAAQQRVAEAVRRAESGQYLAESREQDRQLLA